MTLSRNTTTEHLLSDDAEFRAWAQAIHDALAAVGLVQTADTGQINLTTVSKPGTTTTYAGYEIWRFDDAYQGTWPIYFKVEYGVENPVSVPLLQITVGTGSNGSGTITGGVVPVATGTIDPNTTPTDEAAGVVHVAHSHGALLVWLSGAAAQSASTEYGFLIERLHNDDGTAKDGHIVFAWGSATGDAKVVDGDGTHEIDPTAGLWLLPTSDATALSGGQTNLGGMLPRSRKVEPFCYGLLLYRGTDIADGTVGEVSMYGADVSYRAIGTAVTADVGHPGLILNE